MPMFSWMRWLQETGGKTQEEVASLKTPGIINSRMLITELLQHVEEREHMVWELEREQLLAQSTLGFHWFQNYPRLQTLMSTSELHHIECLCARIPPVHIAAVLSRFREVLATNNVMQWEMHVFKQVLRDFLNKDQCEEEEEEMSTLAASAWLRSLEAWTKHSQMKLGFVRPTVPNSVRAREEIPTISGHVDRAMRCSSSLSGYGDQGLPFYFVENVLE